MLFSHLFSAHSYSQESAYEHSDSQATVNQSINVSFDDSLNITNQVELLITSNSILLSDVLQEQSWQAHEQIVDIPEDSAIWLRFNISNPSNTSRNLTLTVGNTYIDRAEAYLLDEQLRIIQSSRMQNANIDSTSLNTGGVKMDFVARSADTLSIYLQIQDKGLAVLPIELWQSDAYVKRSNHRAVLLGAMSGALALLASYFLLTYILSTTPARFWFCIFATATMTTMLSIEGILPHLFLLPTFAPEITALSLVITLFAAIKIARAIFQPMHRIWVYTHYFLLICALVGVFLLDDYYQLLALIGFSSLFFVSKILATIVYRKSIDFRSAIIYFIGWITLCLVGLSELYTILSNNSYFSFSTSLPFILVCFGVMLIGVAIISTEQFVQAMAENLQAENIKALEQYSDLFQYSAEGLYSADASGKLIHVNPAMCTLFGYTDSKSFIENCDYISKFFSDTRESELLLGELSIQQTVVGREVRGRRSDGREFWFSISAQLQKIGDRANERVMQYGAVFDITEHRINKINLQYLNSHDQLTGLYNRRYFCELIKDRIAESQSTNERFSLIVLDVDEFKIINDSCGHIAGDIFIKELSYRLFESLDTHLPFARLSADRFAILVFNQDDTSLESLATRLLQQVEDFDFKWDQHVFQQSASIGIVSYQPENDKNAKQSAAASTQGDTYYLDAEQLIVNSDTAIAFAKQANRGGASIKVQFYTEDLNAHSRDEQHLYWVNEVNKALLNNNFELFYQHYRPITKSENSEHYEILLRLRTDDGQLIAPQLFLPSSERANIGQKIDKHVIETFFAWLSADASRLTALGKANINLSGMSVIDEDFRFFLVNAFDKYQIPHEKLCFEIKETNAVINTRECIDFIKAFKKYGCTFALDDFGGGFSSYGFLKDMPVDEVKIDGNYIRNILNDKMDLAMVSSIVDAAKAMNMKTTAEFVESTDILVQVGKLGIDYAQGLSIAKPTALKHYKPFSATSEK